MMKLARKLPWCNFCKVQNPGNTLRKDGLEEKEGGRTEKIILVSQKFGPQKSGNIAKLGLSGVELEIVLLRFFYIVFF